jgi:hypothetical protein
MSFSVHITADGKLNEEMSNFCVPGEYPILALHKMPEIRELSSVMIFNKSTETLTSEPKFIEGPLTTIDEGGKQVLISRPTAYYDYSAAITRDFITRSMIIGDLSKIMPAFCHIASPVTPVMITTTTGNLAVKSKIDGPNEGDMSIPEYFHSDAPAVEKESVIISIYLQLILTCITAFKIKKFVHGALNLKEIFFFFVGTKFTVNFAEYTTESTVRGEFPMIHKFYYSSGMAVYSPGGGLSRTIEIPPAHCGNGTGTGPTIGVMSDIYTLTRDLWALTRYPVFERVFMYFSGPARTNPELWKHMDFLPNLICTNSVNENSFMRYILLIFRGMLHKHKPNIYFVNDHIFGDYFSSEFDYRTYFKRASPLAKANMEISWRETMLPNLELLNIEKVLQGGGDIFMAAESLQLDFFLNDEEMAKFKSHPNYHKLVEKRNKILKIK